MTERDGVAEATLDRPRVEEEEVRRLLAEAGPRSEVPAWDLAAIKAAARREWSDMVRAERERKRLVRGSGALALAASLVLAVLAAWWWSARTAPSAPERVASIEVVRGAVTVEEVAERHGAPGASVGERLPAGAVVSTGDGADGRLAVRLEGGHSLRLDGGSRARLLSARRLELLRGAVYLDSGPLPAVGPPVEIVTAFGIVRDIGTQFEVRLGAGASAVRVRVREGKVSLDSDGSTHLAAAGEELSLDSDGSVMRAQVEPWGGVWEWVERSAPGLEIDNLPLAGYLDWVSRETGLDVEWESTALERSAASIRLHGTITELTPRESLTVLLPASGLGWEVEPGVLRITAAG